MFCRVIVIIRCSMFCLMAHNDTSDSKIEPISEVRAIDVTVYCHNDNVERVSGISMFMHVMIAPST